MSIHTKIAKIAVMTEEQRRSSGSEAAYHMMGAQIDARRSSVTRWIPHTHTLADLYLIQCETCSYLSDFADKAKAKYWDAHNETTTTTYRTAEAQINALKALEPLLRNWSINRRLNHEASAIRVEILNDCKAKYMTDKEGK